jgi:16S rRNA (guanine527-N7)-methyltransferase
MKELAEWTRLIGLDLSPIQLEQFRAYESLLIEWNKQIALTAIRELREIRIRHFYDSLTCATATGPLGGQSLIDVGTGAGFPGLPLKILYPEIHLTLLESVSKKTKFLKAVSHELGLKDVTIISARAEDIGQNPHHRERYDWAVARAVAELRILAEYLLPLVRLGGYMLTQKGKGVAEEVVAARAAIERCGGGEVKLSAVQLPETEQTHYLVVIDKIRHTEPSLPRRAGMPTKRPL